MQKTIEKSGEIVYNSGGVKCSEMSVKWCKSEPVLHRIGENRSKSLFGHPLFIPFLPLIWLF